MPDDVAQIGVTITGTASGINTAAQQAGAAIKQLEAELKSLQTYAGQGVKGLDGEIAKVTASLNAATAAAQGTAAAVANSNQAIAGTATAARTAAGAHENLRLATAGTTREFLVLGHEVLTGNFNRIPGSLVVLAERAGSLHTIVAGLASPWGAVGVAGVAALGAIGYAAYEAYEGIRAVKDTVASLSLQGLGDQTAQITALRDQLTGGSYNESSGGAGKVLEAFKGLPAELAPLRGEFTQLAEALAQIQRTGSDKTAEQIAKAFEHGGASALTWADKLANVREMTTATGLTVGQLVTAFDAAGNKGAAARVIMEALAARGITQVGQAAAEAKNEVANLETTISQMDFAVPVANLEELARAQEKVKNAAAGFNFAEPEAITTGRAVEQHALPELQQRLNIQKEINSLTAVQAALQAQVDQAMESGTAGDLANAKAAQQQNLNAQTALQIELTKIHGAEQTSDHEKFVQQSQERLRIYQNEAAVRLDTLTKAAAEEEKYAPGTAQAAAAQARVREEVQRQAREAAQAKIDAQRDIAAAARPGSPERVTAAANIAGLDKSKGPSGEDLFPEAQQRAGERAITAAQRAEEDQRFRDFKAEKEREIQENRGSIAIINADRAAIAREAVATNQPQSAISENARALVREQQEAQRENFRAQEEGLASANRIADAQLGIRRAQLGAEVAAHSIAKSQELSQEAAFSTEIMAQEEARAAAVLNSIQGNNQEALREREKLNEQLASLYAKDAENQANIQKQITAAIETENKKRAEGFTTLFDSAGSGLERYLTSALTGGTTGPQARQQLVTGLVGDVAKSALGMGSRYLGGQVASAAGVKTSENAGLGEALGLALAKQVGLYKEPPKSANENVADLLKTSNEYNKSANTLLGEIAKNTGRGGAAAPTGVKGTGAAAASATGEPAAPGELGAAQSAVNHALLSQGERLKQYCATLVNEALESAGVKGSGSGLASSFKNYGSAVDPKDVRAGDVFYQGPSGRGDTGHVGLTMGGVQNGQVQVMSSHMQGPDSNPAGVEYRNAANLEFRRPDYGAATGAGTGGGVGQQQLAQSTKQLSDAQQQAATTQKTATDAVTANAQDVNQDSQALKQHGASAQQSSSALGGAGGGAGLVGGVQQLTGALGPVAPSLRLFSGALGATQSIVSGFGSIMSAVGAVASAKSALSLIPVVGGLFTSGGVVPSAAGGMIVPGGALAGGGQVSILHPNEMVLPAHLSAAVQSAARGSMSPGSMSLAGSRPNFETLSSPRNVNTNSGNNTMTYAPTVNANGGGLSKGAIRNILRSHGDEFEATARNMMRNGRF